jgi:hypothetical protein
MAGKEFEAFGMEYRTPSLIVRALYGMTSSGAAFRDFCAEQLDKMNFYSTTGDPIVCIRTCVDGHGDAFHEHILVYVDNVKSISFDPESSINQLKDYVFTLKGGKTAEPESYVGAELAYTRIAI